MDFWRLLGYSKISFHHHSHPVTIQKRNGEEINLLELVQSATPPCRLNPFLFNGHLQTLWTTVRSKDIPIYYKRKVFEAEDVTYAGHFAVDFVVAPNELSDDALPPRTSFFKNSEFESFVALDAKPMLVVLHGLVGGSHEIYLRQVVRPIVEAGWEACVVNARGCAESKLSTGVLYNARATWDLRQTVRWLKVAFPNRRLFGLGFSLGANIIVNYLGEEGSSCMLEAVVVCSNPWNLEVGSLALQRSWLGLHVYSRAMATNMKTLFEKHLYAMSKNSRIDVAKVRSIKYLHEFDRELQGPQTPYDCRLFFLLGTFRGACSSNGYDRPGGYPTEGAYYRDASSVDSLLAVQVPLLAIHAEDDPVIMLEVSSLLVDETKDLQIAAKEGLPIEECKQNPYAILCTTSLGGHLGWFETGGNRWFAKPASQFLVKIANEVKPVECRQHSEQTKVVDWIANSKASHAFEPMRRKYSVLKEGE